MFANLKIIPTSQGYDLCLQLALPLCLQLYVCSSFPFLLIWRVYYSAIEGLTWLRLHRYVSPKTLIEVDNLRMFLLTQIRGFLVCQLDKLLDWLSRQTSVVNFRYYLFCLCNVRRQYLLPGILGIYCFFVFFCHSAAKRPYLLTCKSIINFLSADVTASFWLALTQCWLNVVPSSMTLFQHWTNIVPGYRVAGVPCKNKTFSQCCFTAEPWS